MPVELKWYNDEKTILYIQVAGEWTWDDFVATDLEIRQMGDAVEHTFDAITDLTESAQLPIGDMMSSVARSININPPNFRLSVWVKTPKLLQAAIEVLNASTTGYPKRLFVATVEEALAIIARCEANN